MLKQLLILNLLRLLCLLLELVIQLTDIMLYSYYRSPLHF